MKQENSFSVSRFKNRNGVSSFRVDGRLSGVRIRRNFKTVEQAAAKKTALEIKVLQMASTLRAVTTRLSGRPSLTVLSTPCNHSQRKETSYLPLVLPLELFV